MATKKKQSAAAEIDWYLISIDRLKQIGLVILLLLLAGAGYWFWKSKEGNPKANAESAIAEARQSLNRLAASPEQYNARRNEFNRAQQKLDEARAHLVATRFSEAQGAAVESHTISTAALTGVSDAENDAQFITVEGDVKFQKASSSEWRDAESRTALFNGDWVKTGGRASAELMFSNGALYTVGPNALLEIYAAVAPGSTSKTNSVTMQVGSIEVDTRVKDAIANIRTPGTQVIVESQSMAQVDVDQGKDTDVTASRGAASVAPATGGPAVRLAAGERVSASEQGALTQVKKLAPPPVLGSPGDNQILQFSPELQIEFLWNAQPNTPSYILQVSRSRLFTTQEINSRRQRTSARAKITEEGVFYWRVASIGPDGEPGPFAEARKFRVVGGGGRPTVDKNAPKLTLNRPFSLGGQFFTISGTTEAGASVFINDEEADVDSNGAFTKVISVAKVGRNDVVVKAVDASGNQEVQSQTVVVQED